MANSELFPGVPRPLAAALVARGFTELTAVQEAVVACEHDADLRISSATGSGKTVALGFALASAFDGAAEATGGERGGKAARPAGLVIAPTRELAAQLGREFGWLYAELSVRTAILTGGSSLSGDFRALRARPDLIIGTPGRLVDHVKRGSIDLTGVATVALDEADEMLDMGFRDDLESLLAETPAERRTHLVSATFPGPVLSLANRFQCKPIAIEGTPGGAPNADIDHVAMPVRPRDRVDALVNVLLAAGKTRTLVFTRTRAGASELASALLGEGFSASALSGDMNQRERNATVEAFRAGQVDIVVATDVAARGLDIDDVASVVHFDPPDNDEVYTHRSGRTGRAGRKGQAILFVPPPSMRRAERMASRLGIEMQESAPPSPKRIRKLANRRLIERIGELVETHEQTLADATADTSAVSGRQAIAERLLADHDPLALVSSLLELSDHRGPCQPRSLEPIAQSERRGASRGGHAPGRGGRFGGSKAGRVKDASFSRFHVSWGAANGANKARVLALVCRRGGVHGTDVGAIRVSRHSTTVEISQERADTFASASQRHDARNPNIRIRPLREPEAVRGGRPHR